MLKKKKSNKKVRKATKLHKFQQKEKADNRDAAG